LVLADWAEWSFAPIDERCWSHTGGAFWGYRPACTAPALLVSAPHLARVFRGRLVTPDNRAGWDAASVAHLALHCRDDRGFHVARSGFAEQIAWPEAAAAPSGRGWQAALSFEGPAA
jgi:hypothetical protein